MQDIKFKVDFVFHLEFQKSFVSHLLNFLLMEIASSRDVKLSMITDVLNVLMNLVFYQMGDVCKEGLKVVQPIISAEIVKHV